MSAAMQTRRTRLTIPSNHCHCPDVYVRLREVMESDNASMQDAARSFRWTRRLRARVLRMANSASTASAARWIHDHARQHPRHAEDPRPGAGCQRFEGLRGFSNELIDIDTFWYRSVHAAFATIAEGAGLRNTESMFVRGLLHDIGHLVLFTRYPLECRHALAHADEGLDARLYEEHS